MNEKINKKSLSLKKKNKKITIFNLFCCNNLIKNNYFFNLFDCDNLIKKFYWYFYIILKRDIR